MTVRGPDGRDLQHGGGLERERPGRAAHGRRRHGRVGRRHEPSPPPIARYGPFAMNTREGIAQAAKEYRQGRFLK